MEIRDEEEGSKIEVGGERMVKNNDKEKLNKQTDGDKPRVR
jgi:hypothetical protein